MSKSKYSHAFLVGSLNVQSLKPTDLNLALWQRIILSEDEYKERLSDYYQSLLDSMIEAEGQRRPSRLHDVQHFEISVDTKCENPFNVVLTKGRKKIPFNYELCLCKLHLFFFPFDVVLLAIEIDDTGTELDLMTLGHGALINMNICEAGNDILLHYMDPVIELLPDKNINKIVKDDNNLKIFQIVQTDSDAPDDKLLYELGCFSPIGAVGKKGNLSPSEDYFNTIIKENSVSAFYNWKGLALVDSFTVLGANGFNEWPWLNYYFPLIYLRCIFEKTFCFSRNSSYRLDKENESLSQDIADMEKFYFYNNISYNFLPNMLYAAISKGLALKEEREEISKQIKEATKKKKEEQKEKEERRFNNILAGVSIFAVISVVWDFCSIVKDASGVDSSHNVPTFARIFMVIGIILIVFLWHHIYKRKDEENNKNNFQSS